MTRRRLRAGVSALAVSAAVAVTSCPAAGAITPPQVDPQATPPAGTAGPVQAMLQRGQCLTAGVLPGRDPGAPNANDQLLNLAGAWAYSRGEGQTVAVVDTGVRPGPRLPNVDPGGDFVETTDGLTDCDGHGTLVAGVIAGQPGADAFSGVAPAARILSIRQTSARYAPRAGGADPTVVRASVDVATMARAVVRAADLGARVINVSTVTCVPANTAVDQTELGAALRYAAVDKDAVIVAAAGNDRAGLNAGTACPSNALSDPSRPDDPRNWAAVTTLAIPAMWPQYVLSVGSVTPTGQPSDFTSAGPWVGVAAPGQDIASVGNADGGGLANALPNDRGELFELRGTSYAAAYVSGVAALVRSRFPQLRAEDVIRRITASAHGAARSPSNLVGSGTVDPVAALTWDVQSLGGTAEFGDTEQPSPAVVAAPADPVPADHTGRTVAFVGAGVLLVAAAVTAVAAHRRKEAR